MNKIGSLVRGWWKGGNAGRFKNLSPFGYAQGKPFTLWLRSGQAFHPSATLRACLSPFKGEGGFALILAMLVLVAMTFLGMAAIMSSTTESDLSGNYRRNKVAQASAEACIQSVFAQLSATNVLTPISGTLPGGRGHFRTPVPADCASNSDAIGTTHPNYTPFGRPKPPYRDRRSGIFTPGMNIVRSGSGQASSWGYRLYEVECEGWVPDPFTSTPEKPDQSLARVVSRSAAGKLGPEGGSWSTEY